MLYEIFGSSTLSAGKFYADVYLCGVLAWVGLLISSYVFFYCKWWVDDKEGERGGLAKLLAKHLGWSNGSASVLVYLGGGFWSLFIIIADIYPVLVPITALFFGGLFGLRGFVRFKKKVDKALELSND